MNCKETRSYDIVVAGGGVAGVAAALEAARCGKKVVVLDKTTQLGGLATIGLINLFVPMCNGRGVQIIKGMADEFLRLSIKYGYDTIPKDWKDGEPGYNKTSQRLVSKYSAPIFSLVLCEILQQNNVDIMFDTVVTDVKVNGGHIEEIYAFNKSGFTCYKADMFVDATGDCDLLAFANIPTVTRGNYHSYNGFIATLETCKRVVETEDMAHLEGYINGGIANLYGNNHPEGMPLWDGTDGDQVTEYLKVNQLEMLEKIKGDDRKKRHITILPHMAQFRTTRHIDGDYTLTTDDVYKHFDDSIGAICDFDNKDDLYEVPYRTMVKKGYDNVIAVGRGAAADGYAWDILRVIPPAIITGQAAGAAVSQAIDEMKAITDINIGKLQSKLESENVMIHFDDALINRDEDKGEQFDTGHF